MLQREAIYLVNRELNTYLHHPPEAVEAAHLGGSVQRSHAVPGPSQEVIIIIIIIITVTITIITWPGGLPRPLQRCRGTAAPPGGPPEPPGTPETRRTRPGWHWRCN